MSPQAGLLLAILITAVAILAILAFGIVMIARAIQGVAEAIANMRLVIRDDHHGGDGDDDPDPLPVSDPAPHLRVVGREAA